MPQVGGATKDGNGAAIDLWRGTDGTCRRGNCGLTLSFASRPASRSGGVLLVRADCIVESTIAGSWLNLMGIAENFGHLSEMDMSGPKGVDGECGREICAWCVPPRDIGPAPGFQLGEFTHGICPACCELFFGHSAVKLPALPATTGGGLWADILNVRNEPMNKTSRRVCRSRSGAANGRARVSPFAFLVFPHRP